VAREDLNLGPLLYQSLSARCDPLAFPLVAPGVWAADSLLASVVAAASLVPAILVALVGVDRESS
jgi:hypothetical protein